MDVGDALVFTFALGQSRLLSIGSVPGTVPRALHVFLSNPPGIPLEGWRNEAQGVCLTPKPRPRSPLTPFSGSSS